MNKMRRLWFGLLLLVLVAGVRGRALASDAATEYITITVTATDDNGNLQYAIDEPVNFSPVNTFTILAGSSHTIYVKDAAGNITSQQYPGTGTNTVVSGSAPANTGGTYEVTTGSGDQEINIEMELGLNPEGIGVEGESATTPSFSGDYENYEYLTDTVIEDPGSEVKSKTTTNGSDTAKKVFYTITTAEGDPFYLVIDQGSSNAVHLLNAVTREDLTALAAGQEGEGDTQEKEDTLLEALNSGKKEATEPVASLDEAGSDNSLILVLIIGGIAAGGYYYFKIYKKKKEEAMDAMDAMDMDEFAREEEEEELNFEEEINDEKKQQLLDELIASEEASLQEDFPYAEPEEDAAAYPEGEEYIEEEETGYGSPTDELINYINNANNATQEYDEELEATLAAAQEYDEELDGEE